MKMSSLRYQMRYLNPYDVHKMIINDYILKRPGDTCLLKRDSSKDRNDYHVIAENHKFLWEEGDPADTWEQQFAKRYYNKLFKEYCIGDLSRYKDNKIALRWRIKKEVVTGKGQFSCGNKECNEEASLRSWEVNFGYIEHGEKKNALVKIRLCRECSKKLNYHNKKKEVKRLKRKNSMYKKNNYSPEVGSSATTFVPVEIEEENTAEKADISKTEEESPWQNHKPIEQKSREEEMEEYLQDLLV